MKPAVSIHLQIQFRDGREMMLPHPDSGTAPYWINLSPTGSRAIKPEEMHEVLWQVATARRLMRIDPPPASTPAVSDQA